MELLIVFRYTEPSRILVSDVEEYGLVDSRSDILYFMKNCRKSFIKQSEVLYFGDPNEWPFEEVR